MKQAEVFSKLCEKTLLKDTELGREMWSRMVSKEEGEMILTLPATLEEFCERNNLEKEAAEEILKSFDLRGVMIPRNKDGITVYTHLKNPIAFGDSIGFPLLAGTYEATDEQKEFLDLYDTWRETDAISMWKNSDRITSELYRTHTKKINFQKSRIIPLPGTMEDPSSVLPIEDLNHILRTAYKIVLNKCICNEPRFQKGTSEGNNEVCFHFSPFETDYMLERGLGREITPDEAIELVETTMKEQGLVPLANGGKPQTYQVCMCDARGCAVSRPKGQLGLFLFFPSRYLAVVDKDTCTTCGKCVKRCPYGYITLKKDMEAYDKEGKSVMKVVVDKDQCVGCGVCVVKCPTKAIILKVVRPEEYIHEGPTICALDDAEGYGAAVAVKAGS